MTTLLIANHPLFTIPATGTEVDWSHVIAFLLPIALALLGGRFPIIAALLAAILKVKPAPAPTPIPVPADPAVPAGDHPYLDLVLNWLRSIAARRKAGKEPSPEEIAMIPAMTALLSGTAKKVVVLACLALASGYAQAAPVRDMLAAFTKNGLPDSQCPGGRCPYPKAAPPSPQAHPLPAPAPMAMPSRSGPACPGQAGCAVACGGRAECGRIYCTCRYDREVDAGHSTSAPPRPTVAVATRRHPVKRIVRCLCGR